MEIHSFCDLAAAPLHSLFAYIGPGADLGLIGSVIGLLLTVGTSLGFMLLWPFRSLIRKIRGTDQKLPDDTAAP